MDTAKRRKWFLHDNRGVALVTVLFVATLASIMVVSMTFDEQVSIRRTGNLIESDQAFLVAKGVVSWGAQILMQDANSANTVHLNQNWAFGLPPTEIDGGTVSGDIEDMQGRFNLNNLVSTDNNVKAFSRKQFKRMLEMCDIDADLVNVVVDWIDEDTIIEIPNGAEDAAYSGLEMPCRTANSQMESPSELRLVLGIDKEGYSCLYPYITALPDDSVEINVNTASAFIVASLDDNISLNDAKNLVEKRPGNGYADVGDFINEPVLSGIWTGKTPSTTIPAAAVLSVDSTFFQARANVRIGGSEIELYGMMQRDLNNKVTVLSKTIGAMEGS